MPFPRRYLAAAACALLVAGCARLGGLPFQPTVTRPLALRPGHTIGQTFQAPAAAGAVSGVDLLTATYGAPADPTGRLEVVLRAGPGGRVLATGAADGDRVADSGWTPVRFADQRRPPPAPAEVAIQVSWGGAGTVGLWANVPPEPRPPGALANAPYPGGVLLVDGAPADGDLAFRALGSAGARALPATLAGAAREAGTRLLGQPLFAMGWLALVAAAAALAVAGFRRGRQRPAQQAGQGRPAQADWGHDEAGAGQPPDPVGESGGR
ncbi:MAG TPA: hypothetical protein VG452_02460 [Egibacteraceae bacterium]|nr:hypothetical protein [Egibacteraceae bacterium]